MNTKSFSSGFTLVELAIVLTIIGLLIGGVLKGQQMLENSRVLSTIAQIKSFETAIITFKDQYGGLPGDILATSHLTGCTSANYCADGNQDNRIGLATNLAVTVAGATENTQFWKQLALANLISGVATNTNTATVAEWGKSAPGAKYAGGFDVLYTIAFVIPEGHWFRMAMKPTGLATDATQALTPYVADWLDRKLDDGRSNTGNMITDEPYAASLGQCEGGFYVASNNTDKICTPYIKING